MARQTVLWIVVVCGAALFSSSRSAHSGGSATQQEYWVEEVATGLDLPRAIAWLPNGDMLVTEWAGKIRVMRDGHTTGWIEGVPAVYTGNFDGLRDIKLDPDFAQNRRVYLTYVDGDARERYGRVFRARLEGHKLLDGEVIFTAKPSMPEMGGPLMMRMLFLPDKTMLVGVGSGDQGSIALVQRMDVHVGKIVRIRRDGSAPDDNPFVNTPGALPEIWAVGLRNASGFTTTEDGRLWTVDIGPKGGDELNELKPGANYGWPLVTWGFDYSGNAMSAQQGGVKGFSDPALVWVPAFTPSDVAQYRGTTYPFWNGDLFVTGLSGQSLRRLRLNDGKVVLQETMLADLNERWRSVYVGRDGLLYLLTDAYGKGRMLRLRPGAPAGNARVAKTLFSGNSNRVDGAPIDAGQELNRKQMQGYQYSPEKSAQAFAQFCSGCHAFDRFTAGRIGPDLNGINGRRSGSLRDYGYSEAFTNADRELVWNYLTLTRFLQQGQVYFPGNRMSIPPLPFMTTLEIVDFLTHGDWGRLLHPGDGVVEHSEQGALTQGSPKQEKNREVGER